MATAVGGTLFRSGSEGNRIKPQIGGFSRVNGPTSGLTRFL
jgi:hypothetical protein